MLEAAAAQQELTNQTMLAEQAAAGNADAIAALEKIAKTEAAAEREATQARTQGAESARLMGLAARFEAEALQEAELALVQQNAESERWTGLAEESKQLLDELAGGHTLTAREAEAYAEAQDLASEAEANRMETLQGLASGMADFFLGTKDLNEKNIQNEADFHASIASMRADARADTESTAQAQAEKLAEIEQQRADKIAWVQTGSHARTAEENAAALGHWNSHFDKLVTTTNDKYGEQTAAIAANLAEQQAAQAAAREQEAAEYEAHLEELKLKAALGALETTGQLGELTGGLATSAGEAMDLINAGIIPVTEEMGGLIQGTLEGMATKSEEASAIAAENQAILKEAYAGTLEPMTAQNDMLAVGMPESAALNTEAMGVMAEGMQIGFEETMVSSDTTNEAIAKIGTVTLPAVEKQSDVTTQAMVTHFGRVGKAALKAGDEIEKGMKKGIKVLESLAKRAEIAAKAFEKLADAARQAASAAASASAASSTGGANFQHGTPPGGFTVPPGFPNDSFRIGATSGERVTVQTPQQQGNTFNLNVNSSLPSAGVVNDFRLMEALAG